MAIPSHPLFQLTRLASSAAIKAVPGKVWRIDLYGTSDAASLLLYNAASATGTEVYGMVVPFTDTDASAASSVSISFVDVGGLSFSSKIYAALTGTGAIAYVWWS